MNSKRLPFARTENVVRKKTVRRSNRSFPCACADSDLNGDLAVDQSIMSDDGIFDGCETIERTVCNAVHQANRCAFFVAAKPFEIIVDDAVTLTNNSNAACAGPFISKKDVAFDQASMSVSQRQRS